VVWLSDFGKFLYGFASHELLANFLSFARVIARISSFLELTLVAKYSLSVFIRIG